MGLPNSYSPRLSMFSFPLYFPRRLQHLLSPRAKAVRDSLTVLGPSLDAVYLVTIAYSSTFGGSTREVKRLKAPTMSEILMGNNPRIHVHLKRIPAGGKLPNRTGLVLLYACCRKGGRPVVCRKTRFNGEA